MQELRRNYTLRMLEREDLAEDPLEQFRRWFEEANAAKSVDWLEVNAMTLATYDIDTAQVDARVVLLKRTDQQGFTFFSNYDSDKGKQLIGHPAASLVLYWPHVERQVRIQGTVAKTDRATSEQYFHDRPRSSQLGAVASCQSAPIAHRSLLEAEVARLEKQYQDQEIPCPENWGGYICTPRSIEFWQGRPDRLHDRFLYSRSAANAAGQWRIERLSP